MRCITFGGMLFLIILLYHDCRHPEARCRPNFHDLMSVLLQESDTIFDIPKEDLATHPSAGYLGADIKAGENMYIQLQKMYYN